MCDYDQGNEASIEWEMGLLFGFVSFFLSLIKARLGFGLAWEWNWDTGVRKVYILLTWFAQVFSFFFSFSFFPCLLFDSDIVNVHVFHLSVNEYFYVR